MIPFFIFPYNPVLGWTVIILLFSSPIWVGGLLNIYYDCKKKGSEFKEDEGC